MWIRLLRVLGFKPLEYVPSGTVLFKGCEGHQVFDLQIALNRVMARKEIPVDGVFDETTETVLKIFQLSRHLKRDGIYGPKTQKALERRLREKKAIRRRFSKED